MYSYRPYRFGDAQRINDLYKIVTGRSRSLEEYEWQWLDAPGGQGEIWLIEVDKPDGSKKLIGHHGIMPLFFNYKNEEFLVGKTENTMVHPDYRRKILYPKYERIFAKEYNSRFSAFFSTAGPAAALRQRKALGYKDHHHWVQYEWVLNKGAVLDYIAMRMRSAERTTRWRPVAPYLEAVGRVASAISRGGYFHEHGHITALNTKEAEAHPFLNEFWNNAKADYGFTPRRNRDDLNWKFWKNPYGNRVALVYQGSSDGGAGFAIIRKRTPRCFDIEDIVCHPYRAEIFNSLLKTILSWSTAMGASFLSFTTTSDSSSPAVWIDQMDLRQLRTSFPLSYRPVQEQTMLRKISGELLTAFPSLYNDWYVTSFVGEGR